MQQLCCGCIHWDWVPHEQIFLCSWDQCGFLNRTPSVAKSIFFNGCWELHSPGVGYQDKYLKYSQVLLWCSSKVAAVGSPLTFVTSLALGRFPIWGMISFLLGESYIQPDSCWLPPRCGCHYHTLSDILSWWSWLFLMMIPPLGISCPDGHGVSHDHYSWIGLLNASQLA